jgi:hypothetical protein
MEHGTFLTAKHCFRTLPQGDDLLKVGLGFPLDGIQDEKDLVVKGSSLREIRYDGAGNDIAYIFYDAAATEGAFQTPDFPVLGEVPAVGTELAVVGFPSQKDGIYRKLVTENCQVLDKSGTIPPLPKDPGYDGLLFDSNCAAWFGNSGGPFFTIGRNSEDNRVVTGLAGVVTHTFAVDGLGEILADSIASDQFGKMVLTVNFSPFAQRVSLPLNAYFDSY